MLLLLLVVQVSASCVSYLCRSVCSLLGCLTWWFCAPTALIKAAERSKPEFPSVSGPLIVFTASYPRVCVRVQNSRSHVLTVTFCSSKLLVLPRFAAQAMASVLSDYLLLPPGAFLDHSRLGLGAVDIERVDAKLPPAKCTLLCVAIA